jgi:hypothetical protein
VGIAIEMAARGYLHRIVMGIGQKVRSNLVRLERRLRPSRGEPEGQHCEEAQEQSFVHGNSLEGKIEGRENRTGLAGWTRFAREAGRFSGKSTTFYSEFYPKYLEGGGTGTLFFAYQGCKLLHNLGPHAKLPTV